MAMHKPKKTKRFQPGGLVDSERNLVRDSSNQPIMTGSFPEEDEITARGRAKNAEMFRSLFNRATGRGKSAQNEAGKVAQMEAAREKLGRETQAYVKNKGDADRLSYDAEQGAKAPTSSAKVSDGMDERDRRMEAAASAPKRMPTRPGQGTSGRKPSVSKVPKKPESSAPASKPADKPAAGTSSLRDPQQMAKQKEAPAASNKKPPPFEMPISKFFRGLRERGDADLKSRGMAKGGSVSSASKRADGIAQRGKTRGKVY